jgi:hypothetical protein
LGKHRKIASSWREKASYSGRNLAPPARGLSPCVLGRSTSCLGDFLPRKTAEKEQVSANPRIVPHSWGARNTAARNDACAGAWRCAVTVDTESFWLQKSRKIRGHRCASDCTTEDVYPTVVKAAKNTPKGLSACFSHMFPSHRIASRNSCAKLRLR